MSMLVALEPPATETQLAELQGQLATIQQKIEHLRGGAPQVILPELHDPATGRIDAQKVADFMGLPLKRLADGLGLNYKAVHRSSAAGSFQTALQPVKRSLEILHEFFAQPEIIRVWLNTAHPDLDGRTAVETILGGKGFAVRRLLESAWNGVPA